MAGGQGDSQGTSSPGVNQQFHSNPFSLKPSTVITIQDQNHVGFASFLLLLSTLPRKDHPGHTRERHTQKSKGPGRSQDSFQHLSSPLLQRVTWKCKQKQQTGFLPELLTGEHFPECKGLELFSVSPQSLKELSDFSFFLYSYHTQLFLVCVCAEASTVQAEQDSSLRLYFMDLFSTLPQK